MQELLTEDLAGRRLAALGITKQAGISVLDRRQDGCMRIRVRGTQLALGGGLAKKIRVREVRSEKSRGFDGGIGR